MSTPQDDQEASQQNEDQVRALQVRSLQFYSDELQALLATDRQVWVHFPRLVESLGLDLSRQLEQVRDNKVLAAGIRTFIIPTPRGPRSALFLKLGVLAFYLARIQTSRVREELRGKLELYQAEVADVLYRAFLDVGILEQQELTPAERAYQQAQLVANLARQQMLMEREIGGFHDQLAGQHELLTLHEERLTALELTLASGDRITEDQATEIKEAVKAIAVLAKHNGVKELTFQAIWGSLYRTFSVTVYRNLPRATFSEVMRYLEQLKQAALGGNHP